jgi:hypothetical protein
MPRPVDLETGCDASGLRGADADRPCTDTRGGRNAAERLPAATTRTCARLGTLAVRAPPVPPNDEAPATTAGVVAGGGCPGGGREPENARESRVGTGPPVVDVFGASERKGAEPRNDIDVSNACGSRVL